MDNIKYYNDSLAYDFEMFMPKEKRTQKTVNIVKMPVSKSRTGAKAKTHRMSVSAFAVAASVFVLAAL